MTVEQYCKEKNITLEKYTNMVISRWPKWKIKYAQQPVKDEKSQEKNDHYSYWPGEY